MRKKLFYLFGISLFLIAGFSNLNAQKLEAEKTHELSKDAKKGYLGLFDYNESAKEYTMVFVREKNKKTIYETYKFDYDFNLISQNPEELSLVAASKKYNFIAYDEDPWTNPSVVRVEPNMMGQIVLRKGTISRRWVKPSSYTVGSYIVSTYGYWKYDFIEEKKIKPKIEVEIDFVPGTPKMVKNMALKSAEKVFMVAYMTDEPSVNVQTGKRHFYPRSGETVYFKKASDYTAASGDIVIVGRQFCALNKAYWNRFTALKYSAKDLTQKNETLIDFEFGTDTIYKQILPDQTIALILAPLPAVYVKPGKPNPNTLSFTYLRIDSDANLKERIEFESPSSLWKINNIELLPNGDIYIFGQASMAKNSKYYKQLANDTKFDNFQLMKISNGKLDFLTTTSIEEFEKKLQLPPNMKKIKSYEGKKFKVGLMTISSSGDIFVSGQEKSGNNYGNINLFHFDTKGKLKAQYGYKLVETSKEATSGPTIHAEFENPDNKTFTWIVYEINGSTDAKLLIYPRVATIDLEKATVSDFVAYGYDKKQAFYVDNSRPIVLIDNDEKAVFFGADKKDKILWFLRVKLGQ